jgi:hypothetical protein
MTAPENNYDPMRPLGTPNGVEPEWQPAPMKQTITWARLALLWLRIINGSKDPDVIHEAEEEIIRMGRMLDAAWAKENHQPAGPPDGNL